MTNSMNRRAVVASRHLDQKQVSLRALLRARLIQRIAERHALAHLQPVGPALQDFDAANRPFTAHDAGSARGEQQVRRVFRSTWDVIRTCVRKIEKGSASDRKNRSRTQRSNEGI